MEPALPTSHFPLPTRKLYIVAPRGWCAGVERALEILDYALERFPPPIYVRREIVHNKMVVNAYKKRGVIFVNELDEVPKEQPVIFSAHGIAPSVRKAAKKRGLKTIDATCPLVTKVHNEVLRFVKNGYQVLYIGHRSHEEAVGVMGEAPGAISIIETEDEARSLNLAPGKAIILTQTTLSIDDTKAIIKILKDRFPKVDLPPKEDICYATSNRQAAIKLLIESYKPDLIYAIGSANSSNSNRLCEVAQSLGVPAKLVDGVSDIKPEDWQDKKILGLTAGASAPESLVQEVADFFLRQGFDVEETIFEKEKINFALPKDLIELTPVNSSC